MAADDHHQYAYDGENRIITVDITGAKYGYDANGNRVRKDVGSNYTEYIYFGSEIIAEHGQAGGWSDYIFANGKRIAKADDYEHQIQVSGQGCSACGTQTYSLAFSSLGSLAGHVIQSGDILRWQQWQNTGSIGGVTVSMTDGTKSVSVGSVANQWQSFAVDLSTLQGKTISSVALYEDPATQPGTWTLYYQDIVFTAANGTIQPLFSQNPTVPALSGSGTSGVTSVSTAIHICLDPGCAPANTTTYYHGDQIDSSRLLSNGHGYPVWQGTFLPFGEEYNPQITDNHYKFTGKERDTETGLDYFGARYYSNGLGRFVTADWSVTPVPIPYADLTDPQSFNQYSYVRNIPLNRIDPTGHYDVSPSRCTGQKAAKCQKKYDEAADRFEKARQKDLKSKDPRVRAAAAAFGARGEKNGVHVGFEKTNGIDGKVDPNWNSNGAHKPIDIPVTIDIDRSGEGLQETIAHEGTHVAADLAFLTSYDFATGKYDSALNITHGDSELKAFQAGAVITQEHGFGPNDTSKILQLLHTDPHYKYNINDPIYPTNSPNYPQ